MELERKDVERIAGLAHIEVAEGEFETLRRQLSSIIGYVAKLAEVDTRAVEPTAHATGVANMLREDEVRPSDVQIREALLQAAPGREGDYVKVKAVFG